MNKEMYYAVDASGNKYLFSKEPARFNKFKVWIENLTPGSEILDVTDTYETMGLPDMTWDDEPLLVKLICVNI